jgi:hypothetical protein
MQPGEFEGLAPSVQVCVKLGITIERRELKRLKQYLEQGVPALQGANSDMLEDLRDEIAKPLKVRQSSCPGKVVKLLMKCATRYQVLALLFRGIAAVLQRLVERFCNFGQDSCSKSCSSNTTTKLKARRNTQTFTIFSRAEV